MKKTVMKSVKFNFMMNLISTASSLVFPLITFPYVSRVLGAAGTGRVAFVSSVAAYFSMFASLGIPMYGIRACAKVRDDRYKLSKTVAELLVINTVTVLVAAACLLTAAYTIPKLYAQRELVLIYGIGMVLNIYGVNWLYSALEQYFYITCCSVVFRMITTVMLFLFVTSPQDYLIYGIISVLSSSGVCVINIVLAKKYISFRHLSGLNIVVHLKAVIIFFAMAAATSVYTNLDAIMLGMMRNETEVGYYHAGVRMKSLLVSLITSLGTVLLPRLSYYAERGKSDDFIKIIEKAFRFVLIFSYSISLFFLVFSRETVLFLAGREFEPASVVSAVLMPTVCLIGLSNISGIQVLTPLGREKAVLVSIVAGSVVDLAVNWVYIPRYGAVGAAVGTLLAESVVLAVQCLFISQLIREVVHFGQVYRQILLFSCVGVVVFFIKGRFILPPFISLILGAVVYFGIGLAGLLFMRDPVVVEMIEIVRQKTGIQKRR